MLNGQMHLKDPHIKTSKGGQVEQKGEVKGNGVDTIQGRSLAARSSQWSSVGEERSHHLVVADTSFSQEEQRDSLGTPS